jgi:hypothetical protein
MSKVNISFSGIDTAGSTGLVSVPTVFRRSLEMAYLIYREHTIISSASQDEITQQWLPLISISWTKENGRRDVHFLTNSQALCLSFREARKLWS